jgi:hypothetical protein
MALELLPGFPLRQRFRSLNLFRAWCHATAFFNIVRDRRSRRKPATGGDDFRAPGSR